MQKVATDHRQTTGQQAISRILRTSCARLDRERNRMGRAGLELLAESSGNTPIAPTRSAHHSALCTRNGEIDPRLAAIVETCPTLAEGVRDQLARLAAEG